MFFVCEGKHPKNKGRGEKGLGREPFPLVGGKLDGQMDREREESFSHMTSHPIWPLQIDPST